MRTTILFSVILIVNLSFGQTKEAVFHDKIFKTNIEENHYLVNEIFSSSLAEIKEMKVSEPSNNTEGKFPVYESNKEFILKSTQKERRELSIVAENYIKFINDLISKKLLDTKDINIEISNSYGDKGVLLDRTFPELLDQLNVSYNINERVEIEVGKNIYNYLNKLNKTEIDRTLQNSLNLLAINF